MMNERQKRIFEEEGGADFAYTCDVEGTEWRFRINMLTQLGKIGLVARRIICTVQDGDSVRRGQRFGMICFGSRVDLYLPVDTTIKVKVGERVQAGASIIGNLP